MFEKKEVLDMREIHSFITCCNAGRRMFHQELQQSMKIFQLITAFLLLISAVLGSMRGERESQ